jgi:hypothetical protein
VTKGDLGAKKLCLFLKVFWINSLENNCGFGSGANNQPDLGTTDNCAAQMEAQL